MADVSDLKLERYRLGELPAEERNALEVRLQADPALRARLEALEASDASILRETPPEVFAARLEGRLRRQAVEAEIRARTTGSAHGFAAWKPMLGAAALLAILAVPLIQRSGPRETGVTDERTVPEAPLGAGGTEGAEHNAPAEPATGSAPVPAPSTGETVRLKGLEPHLAIFRKTANGSEPLYPGEKARPGELLRIGYQAGGFTYGAILSVDGNGSVTRHWPDSGDQAARLENGEALLPSSFELDAAPDYERFYFVVSRRPFELDPLLESLHRNESLPEPGKARTAREMRVVRFEVLKENGI
jgi:hypothetical protein